MKKKIVVIGSSNTDMIIKVHRLPVPGETVLGGEFSTAQGGKGANQAVAAARAGGDVVFIARVGDDIYGSEALEGFVKDNIDVSFVVRDENHPSGAASIMIDDEGENIIAVASGANACLSESDILKAEGAIINSGVVLMQLETPIDTVKAASVLAASHNITTILNPAPAMELSSEILKNVSILTPNESEAELLSGIKIASEEDACKAAEILSSKGVETVLITMGARGVFVFSGDYVGLVGGFDIKAVDTTGAGDVFNGALAAGLSEGMSLEQACTFANGAAALSVTKLGAQPSIPIRREIDSFLKEGLSG